MKIQLPEHVKQIIHRLQQEGYDAYAVGGCVRDTLLGRSPQDWDITTSAKPQVVKALFSHTVDTGIAHGTVTVMLDEKCEACNKKFGRVYKRYPEGTAEEKRQYFQIQYGI